MIKPILNLDEVIFDDSEDNGYFNVIEAGTN